MPEAQQATVAPAAGTGPSGDAPWRLTDLISVEALQSIQDTFARAFGIPTVIIDTDAVNATAISHRLSFCEDLTRGSRAGQRCADCDACGMRDAAAGREPAIFECWNGLSDCAIPIAPKGQVLGYFLCGQVLTAPPDTTRYAATADEIGVDPREYLEALREVRVMPFEQYEASVQSMHVLAQMIADQAAASIDSLQMLQAARRAKEETAQLVDELDTILLALRDIGSQPDYEATLNAIADNLGRLIPWNSCVIYLTDEHHDELVPAVVRDPFPDEVAAHRPCKGSGIIGKVALGGGGRRLLDVRSDPDFEPIPGVPAEPESALVVPMVYNGTVAGVIALSRFERRTFTDHDLRVLEVFSAQASVSVQVSKLASENAQRLREERALARLRLAMEPSTSVRAILGEVARVGLELLGADSAAVTATEAGMAPVTVRAGIEPGSADPEPEALAAALRRSLETREPQILPGHGTRLVLPFTAGELTAYGIFRRAAPTPWSTQLTSSLAVQAGLAIDKVGVHERERRLRLQYQRLSELATSLIDAHDGADVHERLLERTPEMLAADVCFIAFLDGGPDAIRVEMRDGVSTSEMTLALRGGARLAAVRLRGEPTPDASVFETWSQEMIRLVEERTGAVAWIAEPLPLPLGALGGLFVGWRTDAAEPPAEQRRILRVVAGAGATALARFAVYLATDATLRERLLELEALTRLAQRTSVLTHREPIVDELLTALRRVGLDNAAYGTLSGTAVEIHRASGLDGDALRDLSVRLSVLQAIDERRRLPLADGTEMLVLPMSVDGRRDAFIAGVASRKQDDQRDRVMATLVRYAGVALENAELHDRRRDAIARLERQHGETAIQYARLERILSVHDALGLVVLEGRGLPSVVRALGEFLAADMLVVSSYGRTLAAWPAEGTVAWRPEPEAGVPPRTIIARDGEHHVAAAPAVLDGRVQAWMIARTRSDFGDVERAAVEYGALLASLELLRERTAVEVETRLRAGFLDELFGGTAAEDAVLERALAFGYDLRRPSRVFLAEHAPAAAGALPADPDLLYTPAAETARHWSAQNLVALRGAVTVVIVPEEPDERDARERRFEDELRATVAARLPDVLLNLAVGTPCDALEDYRSSDLAAQRGLELLRLLGRAGGVFSFRMGNLESMLLQSTRPDVVVRFIDRYVAPLEAYDRCHTSDLRRTLEVYYEVGRTLEEAARRLHIHVSTLRYRLKKASELIGVDLKDGGDALDLQVALKAAQVLGLPT